MEESFLFLCSSFWHFMFFTWLILSCAPPTHARAHTHTHTQTRETAAPPLLILMFLNPLRSSHQPFSVPWFSHFFLGNEASNTLSVFEAYKWRGAEKVFETNRGENRLAKAAASSAVGNFDCHTLSVSSSSLNSCSTPLTPSPLWLKASFPLFRLVLHPTWWFQGAR